MVKRKIHVLIFCVVQLCLVGKLAAQDVNIALHKTVMASSEDPSHPAARAVDGKISRTSVWKAANNKAPHVLEVNLGKYYQVTAIRLHSGLLEEEKTDAEKIQAAGFWSVKNFRLEYWDDANWTVIPGTSVLENRLTSASFHFETPITTFKVRLVADDGEAISVMELEIFGAIAPDMPAPPVSTVDGREKEVSAKNNRGDQPKKIAVSVSEKVTGKSMKYVGYNQGYYFPGTNVSDWLAYSQVNSLRVWTQLNSFVPESAVQVDKLISTVAEFDKRKDQIRQSPENNPFISWSQLYPLYDQANYSSTNGMVLNYVLDETKRLGIEVVLQAGSTDFEDNWSNKWKQWQRYYALAYYTAKRGDVAMYAMQNEPNHRHSGPMPLDRWIIGMQIVSDAIQCAVADVNKKYNKSLRAKFVGPVTAGQNTDWWAAAVRAIRTDYRGNKIDQDLINIFSTHSYNSPAAGYATRVNTIRKLIVENHPEKKALPIVFTEIGRWMNAYLIDKKETMDSPSLFTEWAGIYAANMNNGGYGMWAFKFANTASGTYPRGIKSGHHLTWQGKRITEDRYKNLAFRRPVKTSAGENNGYAVTDGNKLDSSAWQSDSTADEKWVEIDLGDKHRLTAAVVYTGSSYGVYTGPDRIKNFALQYWMNGSWINIPGAAEKNCKYVQVFIPFEEPVSTSKIRFVATDAGSVKLREIKVFGEDFTYDNSYDVAGIQRTGEVVRLFAKGFKNERPLLETTRSIDDNDLDTYTSYDSVTRNYYMWLVNRKTTPLPIDINFSVVGIEPDALITGEMVDHAHYGEVSHVSQMPEKKVVPLILPEQSVMLLTISGRKPVKKTTLRPSADATVRGGSDQKTTDEKSSDQKTNTSDSLHIALNEADPSMHKVSYIRFTVPEKAGRNASKVLFKVAGHTTDSLTRGFRIHVYAIPSALWKERGITWKTAPQLHDTYSLIKGGGVRAFMVGELFFDSVFREHRLDITPVFKSLKSRDLTLILIRESRHSGDDEDKGRLIRLTSRESDNPPSLELWSE